jgi:hypothetical protein
MQLPRTDMTYACPVCHLKLSFDPGKKRMEPASVPPDENDDKPRNVA